jgi:O-antigen/teichoic acid export membrane protein
VDSPVLKGDSELPEMFIKRKHAESDRKKRLPRSFRNVVSNWAGSLISLLIAFFLSPFVVHHLGTTAYGIWVLILSLTGYFGLLDLGVRGTVTRYVAEFHTQGKHKEASRLVSSALVIFTLLGAVALAASMVATLIASRLFHIPQNHLGVLLIVAGASVATTLIGSVFGAVVVGLQQFEISNAVEISLAIVKAVAILLTLGNGRGLLALAIIQLVFSGLTLVTYVLTSRRLYPQLRVRYMLSDKASAQLIFSFGSYMFLLNVSSYLIFYTDSLVVGAFLPLAMVTFFAIAGNLVASSRSLIDGISFTITPLASSLNAGGNRDKIEMIGLAGPRYATMLVLPIAITFALRGKTFIGLWMGAGYADASSKVLQVLSVVLFFSAANQVTRAITLGMNKHRLVAFVNIAEGMLNVALSICLVQAMGIVGVAWGTVLPNLATSLVFWPLYMRRVLNIRASKYVLSTWIYPAIVAIPFALLSLIIDRMWYAPKLWIFFFQVALTLPTAALGFWFGCLSQSERRSWLGRIFSPRVRVEDPA